MYDIPDYSAREGVYTCGERQLGGENEKGRKEYLWWVRQVKQLSGFQLRQSPKKDAVSFLLSTLLQAYLPHQSTTPVYGKYTPQIVCIKVVPV
jgi:hypothetical protein